MTLLNILSALCAVVRSGAPPPPQESPPLQTWVGRLFFATPSAEYCVLLRRWTQVWQTELNKCNNVEQSGILRLCLTKKQSVLGPRKKNSFSMKRNTVATQRVKSEKPWVPTCLRRSWTGRGWFRRRRAAPNAPPAAHRARRDCRSSRPSAPFLPSSCCFRGKQQPRRPLLLSSG